MSEKTLRICHLYPDLLNLYGDRGNILCMRRRLEWRGIDAEVTEVTVGEQADFTQFDLFFIGGGQDFEQEVLLSGGQTYYIPEGYRRIKHIVMALPDADAASAQIAAIYQALDAGESFESQMQRYSYDTSVPPEDAGYLLHADSQLWDEAFLSAALALEKPGDVSEPVVTSAGVHIILYAADEPAGPLALTDEQHDLLTQAALTDKQTRRLEELVSQWREAYDIETHPEWLTFYDE